MTQVPVTTQSPTKVLIVDDSLDMRQLLGRWLEDAGYNTVLAGDAEEGLRICKESAIQIAVCDVRMPKHDGVWLADQLRIQSPHTIVVFATAVEDLLPYVTLRHGVAAYIVKPFRRAEVLSALNRALTMVGGVDPNREPLSDTDLIAWDERWTSSPQTAERNQPK